MPGKYSDELYSKENRNYILGTILLCKTS